jgi:hypothetical protein
MSTNFTTSLLRDVPLRDIMLSVSVVRGIAIILVVGLTFGCVSTEQVKKYADSPEALVDSASVKVAVAYLYLQEGGGKKAEVALTDAKEDLERAIELLNTTFDEDGLAFVLKADEDIQLARTSIKNDDLDDARLLLGLARDDLLSAGTLFIGGSEPIVRERYSVSMEEIPITYYGSVDDVYIGYQSVPHNIAVAAREAFYTYHENEVKEDLERGIFLTEYLISVSSERGNGRFVVWENNFEWPVYELPNGWIGALSQAGCIKALMLAYQATGDERYNEFSEKAIEAFEVDVSEGGLRTARAYGTESYVWYPEYARSEPPYVLNGFITSVIWLREYYETTGYSKARALYEDGLKSIIHFLPSYNQDPNWSYYDAVGHNSSSHYHELHVKQMALLYDLTGDVIFRDYQEKWTSGIE